MGVTEFIDQFFKCLDVYLCEPEEPCEYHNFRPFFPPAAEDEEKEKGEGEGEEESAAATVGLPRRHTHTVIFN